MEEVLEENVADANTYLPFKLVDNAVTKRIVEELDALPDAEEEGMVQCTLTRLFIHCQQAPCQLVGSLTKALCRTFTGLQCLKCGLT